MPRTFDSALWKASVASAGEDICDDGVRTAMVDDLIANHLRAGMRRAAVIDLLGHPTGTGSVRDGTVYSWMTSEDDMHMDCLKLNALFSDDRLVSIYEINP